MSLSNRYAKGDVSRDSTRASSCGGENDEGVDMISGKRKGGKGRKGRGGGALSNRYAKGDVSRDSTRASNCEGQGREGAREQERRGEGGWGFR